jgi:putative two-component system response regulator
VCLADVYDALTTRRCYKEPYSHQVASKYIVNASGKHFDPQIVSAFLQGEKNVLEIKQRYSD